MELHFSCLLKKYNNARILKYLKQMYSDKPSILQNKYSSIFNVFFVSPTLKSRQQKAHKPSTLCMSWT